MRALLRLARHLWLDADDARRALGDDAIDRLEAQVAASERLHTGQVCLCVEASLPPSYLWRWLARGQPIADVAHDRALTLFGKQRVWDTEHNNGVLIYLLLAEHRIEIIADRALARHAAPGNWDELVARLAAECREGRIERGLTAALDAVSALLATHFPAAGAPASVPPEAGLPDRPIVR